jgi:hypothetical protein
MNFKDSMVLPGITGCMVHLLNEAIYAWLHLNNVKRDMGFLQRHSWYSTTNMVK